MRAVWNGTISFGLVSIPISLYPATRREELKFRLLRSSDLSPVNYKRVAEADGKEVPWEQIVKGYEYEKGKFVVIKDEDFKRVDIEATQTVDIMHFVSLAEVDPLFFSTPYYMEVGKGGDKAYVLLRETLARSGKIAISKVVIKTRQHLAAITPEKEGLMLELMHFPDELIDASEFKSPADKSLGKPELNMAAQLVESMTKKWDPAEYADDYREGLKKVIEEKIEAGGDLPALPRKQKKPANVIDLVSVLQESLARTKAKARPAAAAKSRPRRKAA
ncbi:MAG TPA: Ku protein [Verrucomicrobiae bacterium]|nr:Ku protein [Verrucomicrobiae bacterium]